MKEFRAAVIAATTAGGAPAAPGAADRALGAGGGTDATARIIAALLEKS
jgi:tripartite-type tricarboxylate transporter receptor subunit TctC